MIYFRFIILAFSIFLISSCDKDNSSPSTGILSAKINGNNFIPDSSYALLVIDSSFHIRAIGIQGYKNDKILNVERIDGDLSLQLPLNLLFNDSSVYIGYEKDSSSAIKIILSRNFIITKQDTIFNKISGSFSATIVSSNYTDTTFITEGKFDDLPYKLMTSH